MYVRINLNYCKSSGIYIILQVLCRFDFVFFLVEVFHQNYFNILFLKSIVSTLENKTKIIIIITTTKLIN